MSMSSPSDKPRGICIGVQARTECRAPDGTLLSTRETCLDDMATNNFINFFKALLSQDGASVATYTATTYGNVARTITVWGGGPGSATNNFNLTTNSAGNRIVISVGDGSGSAVTPARADKSLVNRRLQANPSAPGLLVNVITLGATMVNTSGSTITAREVGLSWWMDNNATATVEEYLMFHDAIADEAIPNGASYTVTYTFTIP